MRRWALAVCAGVAGGATFTCVFAARYQPTIRPETFAGPVGVGGLTPDEAAKKLRLWWEFEKTQKFDLVAEGVPGKLPQLTPPEMGIDLDDAATVAALPLDGFTTVALDYATHARHAATHMPIVYRSTGKTYDELAERVAKLIGDPHPARVEYVDGSVERTPETAAMELDKSGMFQASEDAVNSGGPLHVPLKVGAKHVPDDALATITDEISEFSTRFPAWNTPRCSNIRLAARRLSGHVVMPGERFGFNEVVGRRTLRKGFKLAGIYKNGKHDTGIGGGICQVSTTLYNASLLANLKIHRRSNHSMPVAYVPLGRDATVDYGNLDLVVENDFSTPIGIVAEYQPGKLTFRVLGKKDPGLSVKITTRPGRTDMRATDTEYVKDPTLPVGKKRVIEPGSVFRSVLTYRKIYRDGKLVETQSLGPSYYGGMTRVVAVGTKAVGTKAVASKTAIKEAARPASLPTRTGGPPPLP